MASINKVILIGSLGKDPETRFTGSGKAVTNFSMATNENWKDHAGEKQERTEWHRIVAWGKLAEICDKLLSKGKQVYVEGRIQTRAWDDREGNKKYTTEIIADRMQLLSAMDKVETGSKEMPQDDSAGFDDVPF